METLNIFVSQGITAAALQQVIDTAPTGATIHLAAGQYVFDQTVTIDRSDISLIGAGSEATTITADPALGNAPVLQLGHALHEEPVISETTLTALAPAGATSLQLDPAHQLQPGDFIYLQQENTAAFFEEIGDTQWQKDKSLRTFLVEVTAIEGNTASLASPLPFDFDPAITTVEHREIIEGNTLSGFTIEGGWGASDPAAFTNTDPATMGSTMILVAGTADATLTDIAISEAASHGVTIANSTNFTADEIQVDGAHNKGVYGNGYAIWIRDVYDSHFTNLDLTDTRHAVVFASYTSATGNDVHVAYTNRDINFHGGRDQDNTVVVDSSIRTGEETGYMSPVVFFNEGTRYGAPTEADANDVTFRNVVGTVREDVVHAHGSGATLSLLGGADTAFTGAGDDLVDLGTGHDKVYASGGFDTLIGGGGDDTAIFDQGIEAYATRWAGDTLIVSDLSGETRLTGFEFVTFGDQTLASNSVAATEATLDGTWHETGGGYAERDGGDGWERLRVTESTDMGADLNAVLVEGSADLNVTGNALANHVLGNDGDNLLEGGAGNDRMFGRRGDDTLLGGDGDDYLNGSTGDDVLVGGTGNDALYGSIGADTFVATQGTNTVYDFDLAEGDMLAFNGDHNGSFDAAFAAFRTGEYAGGGYSFQDSVVDGIDSLTIAALNGESLTLLGVTSDDLLI